MNDSQSVDCPECNSLDHEPRLHRRDFMRRASATAAAATMAFGGSSLLAPGSKRLLAADPVPAAKTRPGEELVRELHASLSTEQRAKLVLPWDHGTENGRGLPTRLGMYNRPIADKTIADNYSAPQQELIGRILRSISSGDEGYRQISRDGTFDSSGAMAQCGALIFGDPTDGGKFSWVFSGHHLTVRCDGNSEEGAAFGGPMYYGHSPHGYSDKNIFYYQTKQVLGVFEALDQSQRAKAVVAGSPGEQSGSVRFRPATESKPGISCSELSPDQHAKIEEVMRSLLSPYRQQDADEVLQIVKTNGGLDKVHLAFYEDKAMKDGERWHFWRLEGPGLVWNYRVLPHVHTFVNISSKIG